jgi:hypothetical protein
MATPSMMRKMAEDDVKESLDAFKSAKVGGDGEHEGWGWGLETKEEV